MFLKSAGATRFCSLPSQRFRSWPLTPAPLMFFFPALRRLLSVVRCSYFSSFHLLSCFLIVMKGCRFVFVLVVLLSACELGRCNTVDLVEKSLDVLCSWIQTNYVREDVETDEAKVPMPASGCDFNFSSPTAYCAHGYGNTDECNCTNSSTIDPALVNLMVASQATARYKESVFRTIGFENAIADARALAPDLTNIYAGFPSGIMRVWPAYSWARTPIPSQPDCSTHGGYCPDFDPRKRPWYGLAAAGPLDVVVLVDTTQAMGELSRLAKAKDAAKAVIGSLASGLSFGQVVAFGSAGKNVTTERHELVRCNTTGFDSLQAFIEGLEYETASTGTNIVGAFEEAYALLTASRKKTPPETSGCRTAIVCIAATADPSLESRIAELNTAWTLDSSDIPPVFVYTYGADKTIQEAHKAVSCAFKGLWKPLDDTEEDHTTVALGFIEYFAAGNMLFTPRWAPPYEDASGLGTIITASKVCRWEMTVPPKMLAVAASDFVLSVDPTFTDELIKNLTALGAFCGPFELNEYDIEQLRGKYRCSSSINKVVVGVSFVIAFAVVVATSVGLWWTTRTRKTSPSGSSAAVDLDAANEHGH